MGRLAAPKNRREGNQMRRKKKRLVGSGQRVRRVDARREAMVT
jgi:hypothetical protein